MTKKSRGGLKAKTMSMRLLFITLLAVVYMMMRVSFANDHVEHTEHTEHVAPVEQAAPAERVEHSEGSKPVETEVAKTPSWFSKLIAPLTEIFHTIDEKLTELQKMDEDIQILKSKVVKYEIENTELKSEKQALEEKQKAEHIKAVAKAEGGQESARPISTLEVADETILSLPPKKIYRSAIKAFSVRDYETSAKAFMQLSDTEDNEVYHTAQVAMFAGVSLYHVGNYKQASKYFERSLKLATKKIDQVRAPAQAGDESDNELAPQAMAWLSLCRAQVGDTNGARHIVQGLIQQYPKSREARRLNRNESF